MLFIIRECPAHKDVKSHGPDSLPRQRRDLCLETSGSDPARITQPLRVSPPWPEEVYGSNCMICSGGVLAKSSPFTSLMLSSNRPKSAGWPFLENLKECV